MNVRGLTTFGNCFFERHNRNHLIDVQEHQLLVVLLVNFASELNREIQLTRFGGDKMIQISCLKSDFEILYSSNYTIL